MKEKKGFALIEVIVALSIFMVVTIALISSYYSYYSFVKDLRYKSTGQNLAQLQLEDIQRAFNNNYPESQNVCNPECPHLDKNFIFDIIENVGGAIKDERVCSHPIKGT